MVTIGQDAAQGEITRSGQPRLAARARQAPWIPLALLLLIWVAAPLIPEETGLRLGMGFRVFFTAALLLSLAFLWLLDQGPMPHPRSTLGVLGSVAAVYLGAVGFIVAIAVISPQFDLPRAEELRADVGPAQRGEMLFWKPEVACFQCHTVGGRGGTRGPELSHVATISGQRVPGLSAERYLMEKVKAGATYDFKVPGYVPMMPAFGRTLSPSQVEDLVAYLLSLR